MSLFRSLPIKERYKVWKLYRDAYPEMSHKEMVKHFDSYQDGGLIHPLFDNNKQAYVDSVINANQDKEWIRRLIQKDAKSIETPKTISGYKSGMQSTHLMADDDNGYVYPSIVEIDGNLKYLGDRAYDYAKETNTGIQFNKKEGTWFARDGYKQGTNVLKEYQNGGFIEDNRGQWAHPGKKTVINSPNITMKGVNYPVFGIGDNGKRTLMKPNKNYNFGNAKKVYEIPMMQNGGQLYDDTTRPDNWLNAEQPLYLQKREDLGKDTYGNYILPDVDIFPTKEQYTKIPNPVAGKVQKIDPDYNSPIEFGALTSGLSAVGLTKPLLSAIDFYNPIPINTGKVAEKTGYYAVRAADNIVSSIPGGKKATKEIVERLMRQRASAERNFSDVKSAIKDYIKKRPINGEYSGVYTDNLLYEYPEIYENAEMPDLINLFLKGDETGLRKLDPKELKLDLIPIDEKYFKRYKGLKNRVYEMPIRKMRSFPDAYQGSYFVNKSNRVVGFEESEYDNLFDVGGHNRYLKLNDDGSATGYYQDLYKYHPDDLFTKHLNNKNPFIAGMLKGGIRAVEKRGKPFFLVGKREYTEPYVTKSLDEYEKYLNTLKDK